MDLPTFELSPLEMQQVAESEVAIAPATARIAVRREDFLLRLCVGETGRNRLFFRLDAPLSPVFKVPDLNTPTTKKILGLLKQDNEVQPSLFEEITFTLWQEELPDLFHEVLAAGNWRRDLALSVGPTTEPVQVSFNGFGSMWFHDSYYPKRRPPVFLTPQGKGLGWEDLKIASDAELSQQILLWLEDPHSDCSFAYHWSQRPYEERIASAIEFKQGTWAEFARVLQLLAWNEDRIWEVRKTMASLGVSFSKKPRSNSQAMRGTEQYELEVDVDVWDETQLSSHLKRGLDILHSYFCPYISPAVENTSIFRRNSRSSPRYTLGYSFPLEPPTQHERLEARLQLRDWLQDKVAPEEIPFLLGETA